MQEYEKIKAEQVAVGTAPDSEESLPPSITDDSAPIHALPGVDVRATPTPESANPAAATPAAKVARASDDAPNSPTG
jgi:hypothetical protein